MLCQDNGLNNGVLFIPQWQNVMNICLILTSLRGLLSLAFIKLLSFGKLIISFYFLHGKNTVPNFDSFSTHTLHLWYNILALVICQHLARINKEMHQTMKPITSYFCSLSNDNASSSISWPGRVSIPD